MTPGRTLKQGGRGIAMSVFLLVCQVFSVPAQGADDRFTRYDMGFRNFLTCELTRISPTAYFKGKSVYVTMIDLFDIRRESDLMIITGAVECFTGQSSTMLYAAVGLKEIMGREQVTYLVIRPRDFTILATELMRHPYKERCGWSRYWLDTN